MRGAEFLGRFQLVIDDVHRNDGIGAETAQELNRVKTDTAAADDQGRIAGLQPCAMLHRIIGRGYAAADDAGFLHRHFTWNSEYHISRYRHVVSKAADIPAANRGAVGFT